VTRLGAALLAGCGAPAAALHPAVMTGDPAPPGPVDDAACPDGGTRWLGADPHVPMAIVSDGRIASAGQACCAEWSRPGAEWRAIDRYGRVVGRARVAAAEGYDATQCYELTLRTAEGEEGAGVYVSGGWTPPPSAEWPPTDAERASFFALAAHADAMFEASGFVDESDRGPAPVADRTLFFRAPGSERDESAPTRFAVAGGKALLVGALRPDGRWATSHLDADMSLSGYAPADAYRPLAAFDMDGDGAPEIVFHESDGPSWADVVLAMEPDDSGRPWSRVAESVGGATI
jgi:hypothetical protein